jgi:predicted RNA polymerase sigma factor
MMPGAVVTTIHRRSGRKILSTLIRHFRNFERAKEALQNAYKKALT